MNVNYMGSPATVAWSSLPVGAAYQTPGCGALYMKAWPARGGKVQQLNLGNGYLIDVDGALQVIPCPDAMVIRNTK